MVTRRHQATIEDVAARSGVSVATVSRTLRGLPNVAPSTRDRVIQAAGAFVQSFVPIVVFFALQRYFVRGILAGSVKG